MNGGARLVCFSKAVDAACRPRRFQVIGFQDFLQFLDRANTRLLREIVLERIRRDPSLTFDPHILNSGHIYDRAGRARLAEIHNSYIELARKNGSPILTFTDTWRCWQKAIESFPFKGLRVKTPVF